MRFPDGELVTGRKWERSSFDVAGSYRLDMSGHPAEQYTVQMSVVTSEITKDVLEPYMLKLIALLLQLEKVSPQIKQLYIQHSSHVTIAPKSLSTLESEELSTKMSTATPEDWSSFEK